MKSRRRSGIFGASVVSALGTGLSRVLGAVRDVAIGHVFGAGRASDAFWMAWTVPSLFRRFVADEGLTGALIPGVAQAEREAGSVEANRLANGALLALLAAGALICAAGMLGAPWLVRLIAPGFADDPGKLELTIALTRWLFPFVVFVSLVSYCEGLLNSAATSSCPSWRRASSAAASPPRRCCWPTTSKNRSSRWSSACWPAG